MMIECPFCKARAQIADSKEGAKVRCGECGRVYGARPIGQKRGSSQSNPMPFILGGVIAVAGVLLFLLTQNEDKPRVVPQNTRTVEVEEPEVPRRGFEAPEVQAAVKMHGYAKAGDRTPLQVRLDGERMWERERGEDEPAWATLDTMERNAKLEAWVDLLADQDNPKGPASWEPYNGDIVDDNMGVITVEVQCTPVGGGIEQRTFTWQVAESGGKFKVVSWSRFEEPVEVASKGSPKSLKGVERVTLSDGSKVVERQPEALEHLAMTPPDLRAEIDELCEKIIDLSLTKELNAAKLRLQAIGKPAIPRLLTKLHEIELTDFDKARQVQNVVSVLRKITDQYFGFEPLDMVGNAMGTTDEMRASAIKQWFAWWYRNGESFTEAEKTDVLEEYAELTEADKKWLEMHKDK